MLITDTALKLMAALAIIGLSKMPKNGYSAPTAIGTPSTLQIKAKHRFCRMLLKQVSVNDNVMFNC